MGSRNYKLFFRIFPYLKVGFSVKLHITCLRSKLTGKNQRTSSIHPNCSSICQCHLGALADRHIHSLHIYLILLQYLQHHIAQPESNHKHSGNSNQPLHGYLYRTFPCRLIAQFISILPNQRIITFAQRNKLSQIGRISVDPCHNLF